MSRPDPQRKQGQTLLALRTRKIKSRQRMPMNREPLKKGPELLSEVLSRLFSARGWGRRQDRLRLEQAWADAIGEDGARQTRLSALRRGVLEIEVGSAVLLQELTHYHKRKLLEQIRRRLPGVTVMDLRFRAGVVKEDRS